MADNTLETALQAIREGYHPIPVMDGLKKPYGSAWNEVEPYTNDESGLERARQYFEKAQADGAHNVGLLLGEPSNGLVDIDLDHVLAIRLADYFLPPTSMESGRTDSPRRHRWYIVEGELPSTRKYKLPNRETSVELRSDGGQTIIPPSGHPSGESYAWDCPPFGGESGPSKVDGRVLALQTAVLAMSAVLLENFPKQGSRHETYLNLAGGLLRYGDTVHEFWEQNLPKVIRAIADVTHDSEKDSRVSEVMASTASKIRNGQPVGGFPKLAEIIGEDSVEHLRRLAREVESLAGYSPDAYASLRGQNQYVEPSPSSTASSTGVDYDDIPDSDEEEQRARNPMEERVSTWEAVDLAPYLSGEIETPKPTILRREDGVYAFYPGRVNMLYGSSESAKTWIAMLACVQQIQLGERTVYIDLEDEPVGTINRMKMLGASVDDLSTQFRYLHPETPLSPMERGKFGSHVTAIGRANNDVFQDFMRRYDPTLVVVDGMTVLYGMHGHDTNDAAGTNVITDWLKSLTRGGRTAVIVIDHTGKQGGSGASPIGAHHKIAMVQGSAIRADATERPMPGQVGSVKLSLFKDRPGEVRQHSTKNTKEQVFAQVEIDSTVPGHVQMTVGKPSTLQVTIGDSPQDEAILKRESEVEKNAGIVAELFGGDMDMELTTSEVVKKTGLKPHQVYAAWSRLEDDEVVVKFGSRKSRVYRLSEPKDSSNGEHDSNVVELRRKDDDD